MSALPKVEGRNAALDHLASLAAAGAGAPWVRNLRREARDALLSLGLPTPDDEEWRAINLTPVFAEPWDLAREEANPGAAVAAVLPRLDPIGIAGIGGPRATFVNGRPVGGVAPDGLPAGVLFASLAETLAKQPDRLEGKLGSLRAHAEHAIAALNTSLLSDGFVLDVPEGVRLEEPIHVLHVTSGDAGPVLSAPRTLLSLGAGSRASLVETYVSPDGATAFVLPHVEVLLAEGASLDHTTIQGEGTGSAHVALLSARLGRDAQLAARLFSLGARVSRNEARVKLDGEGASLSLDGLFCAKGTQVTDAHTHVEHARPHATSQQLYKGIVDGEARGAFDGKVVVRPRAEKTDARQTNRNLILSRSALVDSRPQLEIYNNDVRCTHGSTTGRLDENAFFYLRSRGLDPVAARSLLTWAFASELVSRVKVPVVQTTLERWLLSWLDRRMENPK